MSFPFKNTYQKYERQLARNIKFNITLSYVIFRCVTKFKTNVIVRYIFIFYHSSSKYRKYKTTM